MNGLQQTQGSLGVKDKSNCPLCTVDKNNETHYGYKNHAKVDVKGKLIDQYDTTAANVHDSQVFEQLLDENDQAVLANRTSPLLSSSSWR